MVWMGVSATKLLQAGLRTGSQTPFFTKTHIHVPTHRKTAGSDRFPNEVLQVLGEEIILLEFLFTYLFLFWKGSNEKQSTPIHWFTPQASSTARQGWAKPKPAGKNGTQLSHVCSKNSSAWAIHLLPFWVCMSRKLELGVQLEPELQHSELGRLRIKP